MHYLLFYDVVPDYEQRRITLRQKHIEHAKAAHARGELILGGALADPVDGAVLLFEADTDAPAQAFARADPYVTAGIVTHWYIRAWSTVIGDRAAVKLPAD